MRTRLYALSILALAPALQACQPKPTAEEEKAYAADEANEDAALNTIRDQSNEAMGASVAVSGLIPDENGHVPMANVQ